MKINVASAIGKLNSVFIHTIGSESVFMAI